MLWYHRGFKKVFRKINLRNEKTKLKSKNVSLNVKTLNFTCSDIALSLFSINFKLKNVKLNLCCLVTIQGDQSHSVWCYHHTLKMEKLTASLTGQISLADQLWSRPRATAGGFILVAERFAGRGFVSWCFYFQFNHQMTFSDSGFRDICRQ